MSFLKWQIQSLLCKSYKQQLITNNNATETTTLAANKYINISTARDLLIIGLLYVLKITIIFTSILAYSK